MFNLKRALTATALTTALAGGILGVGAPGATASASGGPGHWGPQWWGPRCVWLQHNNSVHFGHKKNKVTVTKFAHSPFFVRKENGCVRNHFRVW
jgi:hypothetical protein